MKNLLKKTWVRLALVAMVVLAIGATASASPAGKARRTAEDTGGGPYTATVAYVGPFINQLGPFIGSTPKLVLRKVFSGPGDWAVTAVANINESGAVAAAGSSDDHISTVYCELHGSAGNVIGSADDRRLIPAHSTVGVSLSLNGLSTVGPNGGTISLWCSGTAATGLHEAQMMFVQVGGFS